MKISKKATMGISLFIGTMLFTTTVFAEVNSSNGYEQIKDTLKISADKCSTKFDNFTISSSFAIKDGGNLVFQNDAIIKYDNIKYEQESTGTNTSGDNKTEEYFYRDKDGFISYYSTQNVYHQTNYPSEHKDDNLFTNPFKESGVSDIEKIADALVGNLKDYAIVNQKSDGSKEISGSISEAQIPAIVNAVVSYTVKNKYQNEYENQYQGQSFKLPKITDDIYVKEIKANAIVDKDGIIQNVIATGIISGKDAEGAVHELTFEILGKLTDVNSTSINKLDLTGKKVEINTQNDGAESNVLDKAEMYLGTYKNDIVIEKDNKFQKIGERFVDITKIDDKGFAGRYHEQYIDGYDEYSKNAVDFNFSASFADGQKNFVEFKNEDTKGNIKSGNISIMPGAARVNFWINDENNLKTVQFNRVFN